MGAVVTAVLERPRDPRSPRGGKVQPRFRLHRRARKAALIAHVLSSVGWFGIALLVAFAIIAAEVTGDAGLSHSLYRSVELFPWISIPIGGVAVLTGAVLSVGTKWGFIRHWWVVAKIVISIAVIVTDAVVIGHFAHQAAVTGQPAIQLRDGAIAHVVVLAIATVLSVVKPRGRTPWGKRVEARSPAR